jgi:hypothetical protein
MKKRDTIIIALGGTALTAGLAGVLLWDSEVEWAIVPMVLGALALISELLFYILALTQRASEAANADTNENEEMATRRKPSE